ncbi:MAG: HD domain-containing phosphohydrolase [Candidatus Methylomirabilia bacterium]
MGDRTQLPRILVVDDSPEILAALRDSLAGQYEVVTAASGAETWEQLERGVPDLVLLDIVLPDATGYAICVQLKKDVRFAKIPVIFLTSNDRPAEKAKAFAAGAVDFMTKPFQVVELRARIDLHLGLCQARAALANQHRLLEESVLKSTAKLRHILNMSLLLNSERDIDRTFSQVVTEASLILDCDRTTLYLLDAERQVLWTKVAEGIDTVISLPAGRGLAWKAAASGKPYVVADAHADPDFDGSWDRQHGYRTSSVLCHPIHNRKGELKGVLQAINKKEGGFGKEDEELAAALTAQIGVALETGELLDELKGAFESFARTLSRAVEAKHPLTAGHSLRVTEYSLLLGRRLGLSKAELEVLKYACLLHDIGKIGVPDHVLAKQGQFDPEERTLMNGHAIWTDLILSEIRLPRNLLEVTRVAACHHERMDGNGYPNNLKGEAIPFLSRIIAVCDVFDALTSRRDYSKYDGKEVFTRDPFSLEKAFDILTREQGGQFDTRVVAEAHAAREELSACLTEFLAAPR